MEPIVVILLCIAAVWGVGWVFNARGITKKQQRFTGRERMTIEQIQSRFFPDLSTDSKGFSELWTRMANILKLDPTLVRPTDTFDENLGPGPNQMMEDELVDLNEFVGKECVRQRIEIPDQHFKNLDEVVRFLLTERPVSHADGD